MIFECTNESNGEIKYILDNQDGEAVQQILNSLGGSVNFIITGKFDNNNPPPHAVCTWVMNDGRVTPVPARQYLLYQGSECYQ